MGFLLLRCRVFCPVLVLFFFSPSAASQYRAEGKATPSSPLRGSGPGFGERSNCLFFCLGRPLELGYRAAELEVASSLSPSLAFPCSQLFFSSPTGDAPSREAALTTVSVYLTPWMKNDNEVCTVRTVKRGSWGLHGTSCTGRGARASCISCMMRYTR